ncbi:MAG: molybdopterin-dependent oxidoreductase, partial [Oligoflexia bacterium]|nr:molybdopterin-dependent oxidoreductase [Oligoflexia bacterium]
MNKESLVHDSAHTHVQGCSEFISDRPKQEGELVVDFVYSPFAHAKIKSIELDIAKKIPGVEALFTASDIPHNRWGTVEQDQPFLASEYCQYAGEPIVLVAATNKEALQAARNAIHIEFEQLDAILSIEEALRQNSFLLQGALGSSQKIIAGQLQELEAVFTSATNQLLGVFVSAGQEHLYFETQSVVVYPLEDGGVMEIHASTQHPTEVQHVVAHMLGIQLHQVVCIVKRMGGGFGGKESQAAHFAALAALVAYKTKRAARL